MNDLQGVGGGGPGQFDADSPVDYRETVGFWLDWFAKDLQRMQFTAEASLVAMAVDSLRQREGGQPDERRGG